MGSAAISGLIASLVGALGMALAWITLRRARMTPPAHPSPERRWSGGAAVALAVTLSVVVLAGAALLITMARPESDRPNHHTFPPSVGATQPTKPAGPTATVTVTVVAAPPAATTDGGGEDSTAWIAAIGAIIAGFGTLASGAAAVAALRRSGERRPVHHRPDGHSHRPHR